MVCLVVGYGSRAVESPLDGVEDGAGKESRKRWLMWCSIVMTARVLGELLTDQNIEKMEEKRNGKRRKIAWICGEAPIKERKFQTDFVFPHKVTVQVSKFNSEIGGIILKILLY